MTHAIHILTMYRLVFFALFLTSTCLGQSYTSYYTGNPIDKTANPKGGICLMGGATENDSAMRWFLQSADGGDILVLRTSGSNGYNNYLYSSLGVSVNSVETIVFHNAEAAKDPYVKQKIQQAEAIWIAGGDQWSYISNWRNTPLDSLINLAITQKKIAIGGTSAGMAILGDYYFSARYGTVTSENALANPYLNRVTVDTSSFINVNLLKNTITDTHFDNPDRRGRMMTFLARVVNDYNIYLKGIACDEYTAVCIDTSGSARVYGNYPTYNDYAYFIQSNCELQNKAPESCVSGHPLTWNLGSKAIKALRIPGTQSGTYTFNLKDWKTGTGGTWLNWSVNNGVFFEQIGLAPDCEVVSVNEIETNNDILIYPNPSNDRIVISSEDLNLSACIINIYNSKGQKMSVNFIFRSSDKAIINLDNYKTGLYYLQMISQNSEVNSRSFLKL
jgi:cyanophycinase-like exopeptidase